MPLYNEKNHGRKYTTTWHQRLVVIAVFGVGVLVGRHSQRNSLPSQSIPGSIQNLSEIPIRNTSHKDENSNTYITKQQFLEPFAVPNLAGYSVATLHPGQQVPKHSHRSMHEFFYVVEGSGVFRRKDQSVSINPGSFIHVSPREDHSLWVPRDSSKGDLKLLVSGVVLE